MKKAKEAKEGKKEKVSNETKEDRGAMLSLVWGKKKVTRLNKILDTKYCGGLTVREFAALVLADRLNFPKGLDTPMCIGDFEGNFCTNILGVTVGGPKSDHVCVMGDPHGAMV